MAIKMKIGYNKPYFSGNETDYIIDAIMREKISGNGYYTRRCQEFLEKTFQFKKTLLTTSCTDALEMAAILLNIKEGDEVILPSYTFVSTANAFILRGAVVRFVDSLPNHPNIDPKKIEPLINERTKVIVVVHYAGIACEMDEIMALANKHNLFVVEDAAQAITATYKGKPLGGIGHLGCFSFHETKNIIAGEGGLLIINDEQFIQRAEIIWEKGTNRAAHSRGEINKYSWQDIGSSFLPSELIAAFLFAQLENIEKIQKRRLEIWNYYYENLKDIEELKLATIPEYASNNAHIFYLDCKTAKLRNSLLPYLKQQGIDAIFHYLPLHESDYFKQKHDGSDLPNAVHFAECLLRLPLYFELNFAKQDYIIQHIKLFFATEKQQRLLAEAIEQSASFLS